MNGSFFISVVLHRVRHQCGPNLLQTIFLDENIIIIIHIVDADNTLVESARANELDVYEYLKYLLTETPNNHHREDPSVIDSLLPWSKELPEQCLLKRNRKKCLKH